MCLAQAGNLGPALHITVDGPTAQPVFYPWVGNLVEEFGDVQVQLDGTIQFREMVLINRLGSTLVQGINSTNLVVFAQDGNLEIEDSVLGIRNFVLHVAHTNSHVLVPTGVARLHAIGGNVSARRIMLQPPAAFAPESSWNIEHSCVGAWPTQMQCMRYDRPTVFDFSISEVKLHCAVPPDTPWALLLLHPLRNGG